VLVISSHASRENVFKALELGALDFIAKPSQPITSELRSIGEELTHKVRLATQLRMVSLTERALRAVARAAVESVPISLPPPSPRLRQEGAAPPHLVAIAASTGGPPAIQQLLATLEPGLPMGIVITQHMPAKFTRAFAERLQRTTPWSVREAEPGDAVTVGTALVAPGSGSLVVSREGAQLKASVVPQQRDDRFVPSVDRMLESAGRAMGTHCVAVVLTGMGGDGGRGASAVRAAGGRVLVEAPETAVIFGMPQEVISAGAAHDIVPLPALPQAIAKLVRR
jgi:two-component system chemotaxis response regulator CheB